VLKTAPLAADPDRVTPTRICRECQARFVPALQEQSRCPACIRLSRDLEIVDHYMRRAPGESIARIAIATGVAEDAIRAFADDGRLAQMPVDASAPTSCSCPPGETGRCPACRTRLARQFGEARWAAVSGKSKIVDSSGARPGGSQSGMHARPKSRR
jgi:hypothetical protein